MRLITEENLVRIARWLANRDLDLSRVLKTYGPPPLWSRKPGFATLVHIILEQQVSLASARAAFDRLRCEILTVTPEKFLRLDDATLKTIGFSRQKTLYCRLLASAVIERNLKLKRLEQLEDDAIRAELKKIKGIGDWTADIYLLMALRRPDVWPRGDLALLVSMQRLKALPSRPTHEEFEAIAETWKPHRAVAARMLWHFYLSERENAKNAK